MDEGAAGPAVAGQNVSEAQLLERCTRGVEACREALHDLRTHVKAARSNREKCSGLLAAATTAVYNLDELLYSHDLDLAKEKQLQQLCSRVQNAIDQAEAKAKVYGQMNGVTKFAARIFSDTDGKFEELRQELIELGKQAHQVLQAPPQRTSTSNDGLAGAPSSAPIAAGGATASERVEAGDALGSGGSDPASLRSLDALPSKRSFVQRDNHLPVEALQRQRLYRGSRGHAVTAMLYVPPMHPAPPGSMGRMWYYISKPFSGALFVHDLSNQVSLEVKAAKADNVVTVIHLDPVSGWLWTGHKKGYIRVWDEAQREPLCEPLQAFNSHVRALTTDETGAAWAGSDKGNVKCLRLENIERDGAVLGTTLVVKGSLKWAGPGMPAEVVSAGSAGADFGTGMVDNKHFKEPAHYGTVTAIAAALGRVWTAGGSSAFVCLKEWTSRGEFMKSTDLRSVGTANTMLITSPIVRVISGVERPSSITASVASVTMARGGQDRGEIVQAWQLLTGHDCGLIQVWTLIQGMLRPILRIGERMAPAKGIIVCEQLGAVCTAHSDGMLLIRTLPHPKSPSALTITYGHNSVSHVKLTHAEIEASKTGLAAADGGVVGVITASNQGTITLWPEGVLRAAAQERGLALQSEHSPREAWPLLCYWSAELPQVLSEAASATPELLYEVGDSGSDLGPLNSAALATGASGSVAAGMRKQQSIFEQSGGGALDWQIQEQDLRFIKIIGEGAIGKVWLGRFQETDVAIKKLNSLGQLAMGMAQEDSAVAQAPDGNGISPDVLRTLEREVGILVRIRHPNVILFMGVCLEPPCVVTEFCQRGSLYDVLKQAGRNQALSKQLDWVKRINMALDAAKGMFHLHSHRPPILHRDLKSPNLLVDKHWRVKVTDFNLSRITDTGPQVQSSLTANNPRWLAPEVIQRQAFSKASDVYAFGLILWELITWEVPFKDMSQFQIMMALTQQHGRPEIPDAYAQLPGGMFPQYQQYCALMQWCWADDPDQRPGFDQVITELRAILEQLTRSLAGRPAAGAAANSPMLQRGGSRRYDFQVPAALLAAPAAGEAAAPAAAAAGPSTQAAGEAQPPAPPPAVRSPFDTAPGTAQGAATAAVGAAAVCAAATAAAAPVRSPFDAPSAGAPPPPSPFGDTPWQQPGPAAAAPAASQQSEGVEVRRLEEASDKEISLNTIGANSAATVASGEASAPPAAAAPAAAPPAAVLAASGPPPSPFGGFVAPTAAGATVLAANGPPPSPFGDPAPAAAAAPAAAGPSAAGPTVLAANGPPPSPFGDPAPAAAAAPAAAGPSAAGPTVLAANGPPPSPFGGVAAPVALAGAAATAVQPTGPRVLAANGPPPSPFGDPAPAAAAAAAPPAAAGPTILAANGPPPSPFGGPAAPAAAGAAAAAQPTGTRVFAANGAPPSPFGGPAAAAAATAAAAPAARQPAGATVLAANGPPPSPFGDLPYFTAPGAAQAAEQAGSSSPEPELRTREPGEQRLLDSVENNAGMSPSSSQRQAASLAGSAASSGPQAAAPAATAAAPAAAAAAAAATPSVLQPGEPAEPPPSSSPTSPPSRGISLDPSAGLPAAAPQVHAAATEGEDGGGEGSSGRAYQRSVTAPSKLMRKFRATLRRSGDRS